ncbi:Uncharacterized protein APZ42_011214 [Daphnia magna]|uniref:Uncharacterized protein n=1 Tax=Daphnia magna TaxID=35525 RepID=A0A162SHK0_9CRUS|nr:Uncharacterized protein APZ42_011214 [Daphnia magna]
MKTTGTKHGLEKALPRQLERSKQKKFENHRVKLYDNEPCDYCGLTTSFPYYQISSFVMTSRGVRFSFEMPLGISQHSCSSFRPLNIPKTGNDCSNCSYIISIHDAIHFLLDFCLFFSWSTGLTEEFSRIPLVWALVSC